MVNNKINFIVKQLGVKQLDVDQFGTLIVSMNTNGEKVTKQNDHLILAQIY